MTAATVLVCVAAFGVVGSDAWWPIALGNVIRGDGVVPAGVPFAAVPTDGWVNTTVVGQVVMSLWGNVGSVGLVAAQWLSVAVSIAILGWEAARSNTSWITAAVAIALLALGAVPGLFIVRVQLLSLVPFVALLALVRREHESPSARVWFVIPLLALWSNVHGAVLVGVAVTGCYLLFSRLRRDPLSAILLGVGSLVAACLNPGLLRAPLYYWGVLRGEATSDSAGMWGRPDLSNPFDVAMLVSALILVALAARRRPPLWEALAILGLAAGTVMAARNGVWLLFLLAGTVCASGQMGAATDGLGTKRVWRPALACACTSVVLAAGVVATRGPALAQADKEASTVAQLTAGRTTLAPEPLSEHLAAEGATVWASNPLDAFPSAVQASYLAFLKGDAVGAEQAMSRAEVVVAEPGTAQYRLALAHGFRAEHSVGSVVVLTR